MSFKEVNRSQTRLILKPRTEPNKKHNKSEYYDESGWADLHRLFIISTFFLLFISINQSRADKR